MTKSNIFLFNPTCELAVANGSFSYVPPLLLQQMETDLAILPFLMTTKNDFVLSENRPSQKFIEKLVAAGFEVPKFCTLHELENQETNEFGAILPWGWSTAVHYKLRTLKQKCHPEFRNSPVFKWIPEHQLLYERATSLNLLEKLLENEPPEFFIDKRWVGKIITNIEAINLLLQQHGAIVVKAPLSSSGRGIQIIRKKALSRPNSEWISGMLKQQNYVIAEPWIDKLMDVSFQFYTDQKNGLDYLGQTFFETSSNGQYQGSLINPDVKKLLPDVDISELAKLIRTTEEKLRKALQNSFYTRYHEGFLGIDGMIFRRGNKLKIQPCVEVNCRMNMGILSMFCARQLHPNAASGKLRIFYSREQSFSVFSKKMNGKSAPKMTDGKLISGFFPLTEPHPQSKFGGYLYLGDSR